MRTLQPSALKPVLPFVDRWFSRQVALRRLPGVQVAVRVRGELVFSRAYGCTDIHAGTPLETRHLFRVASHSKWFAATIALQLHEQGILALDATVASVLPEYAIGPFAAVTLRELLSHRSGIMRDGIDADHWDLLHPFPDAATLHEVVNEHGKVYEPQQYFKYSNLGYGLVGMMIERATGAPFAQVVQERIVAPLGVKNTASAYLPERAKEYALGHTMMLEDGTTRLVVEHIDTAALDAATGFTSTAEDMTAFACAHTYGDTTLISDHSKRLMHNPVSVFTTPSGSKERYGLGNFGTEVNDRVLIGHSGGYPGQVTRTMVDPETGLAVSVLMNSQDGMPSTLATALVRILDAAVAPAASWNTPVEGVERSSFASRIFTKWEELEIIDTGHRLLLVSHDSPDPGAEAEELRVVDANRLRAADRSGYGAPGEDFVVTRSEAGEMQRIVLGGITHWTARPERSASERVHLKHSPVT